MSNIKLVHSGGNSVSLTTPEPRPPTESPVILPFPLIVTGIRFLTP